MVGEARSLFIEAIDEAEKGNIEKGYEIYDKSCQLLQEAQCHQDLKIESVKTVTDSLLYSHMQCHMLNAETLRILTLKFIKLYEERKNE